jgi:hypothetical protein
MVFNIFFYVSMELLKKYYEFALIIDDFLLLVFAVLFTWTVSKLCFCFILVRNFCQRMSANA